jgi:hypothetical protein
MSDYMCRNKKKRLNSIPGRHIAMSAWLYYSQDDISASRPALKGLGRNIGPPGRHSGRWARAAASAPAFQKLGLQSSQPAGITPRWAGISPSGRSPSGLCPRPELPWAEARSPSRRRQRLPSINARTPGLACSIDRHATLISRPACRSPRPCCVPQPRPPPPPSEAFQASC